jgi:hypothetical protein
MPKEIDKYCNLQKVFTAHESEHFINMKFLALESKLFMSKKIKSMDLISKEMEILLKERKRLLDLASKESDKGPPPPDIFFKEKKYRFKPYLLIYMDELDWERDYYQKPIRDPFVKVAKRGMYGTSKEKFDDIMRLIRIYTKKFKTVKKLKRLQFTDKMEVEERNIAIELQIINSYLISKYTSQMIKGFDVIIKKRKVTVRRPELNVLEVQINNYALMDSILRKIIPISTSLQDEVLSEEVREDYVQSRKKLRKEFNFVMSYENWRALQNGEDFENFWEEYRGAFNDVKKFSKLYLKPPDQVSINESKVDGRMKQLYDIHELLSKTDLTTEERKYFLKREALLEKEVDWEGKMKKLLADFPYEKDRYFPKID